MTERGERDVGSNVGGPGPVETAVSDVACPGCQRQHRVPCAPFPVGTRCPFCLLYFEAQADRVPLRVPRGGHTERCAESNRGLVSYVCTCDEPEPPEAPHWSGHPNEVLMLISRIERLAEGQGNATIQRALAAALWRVTVRHPSTASCVDRETSALVLRDGGRSITLELRLYPHAPEGW